MKTIRDDFKEEVKQYGLTKEELFCDQKMDELWEHMKETYAKDIDIGSIFDMELYMPIECRAYWEIIEELRKEWQDTAVKE